MLLVGPLVLLSVRLVGSLVVAACAFAASLALTASDAPRAEAQFFSSIDLPRSGPLGPITIFGDSVLLGSGITSPTLPDQLAARGWGPIKFHSGVGFNTGFPVRGADGAKATFWFSRWASQGWNAENVVVNLGANDSLFCSNVACMRDQILRLVNHIGPGHHIWWPQITLQSFRRATQDMWNTALAQIANERDDFSTWDWPGEMTAGGYRSSDNIHLTTAGYRQRSNQMADDITVSLAMRAAVDRPPATAATSAQVVVVGDSIAAGNGPMLTPWYDQAASNIHVDAQSGRLIRRSFPFAGATIRSGVESVRELVEAGARPELWVIELGTHELDSINQCACNDPVAFAGTEIDALLAELPAGARLAWITVHDPSKHAAAQAFNTALRVRAIPAIDWAGSVYGRTGLFLDEVHPSLAGVGVLGELLVHQIQAYLQTSGPTGMQAERLGVVAYDAAFGG